MNNSIKSQWIMANAGSGKTTTLTARVVRLLLLGVAPENIVCITYTKAAASEMRHRVLELLRKLLLMGDVECETKVSELIGAQPNAEQMVRARRLFGQVLDSPTGGLQLTTIHGFCQNILRRFPIEAEIAPHFTVLEDAMADEMLRKAKHALLTSIEFADVWLTDALAMIGARGGEYRFETLAADIITKRRMWDEIWRGQSPEVLRARVWQEHGLDDGVTQAALDGWMCAALTAEDVAVVHEHLPALVNHKTQTYREFGEGLAACLTDYQQHIAKLVALFVKADTEPYKQLLNKKEYPEGHALCEAVERIAAQAVMYAKRKASLACAEESFAVAVLAKALMQLYAQAKASIHALDYDDLIERTLRLCSHPATLGWVMTKLDHRIDHLLIDEAQDNSLAQWQLAQLLVEELIAANNGVGSANLPRSLLVVGDEKQSIYSFQGAAPELFSRYRSSFTTMLDGSDSPLTQESLSNSWRSAEAVLKLVDHVCAQPEISRAVCFDGKLEKHQLQRANAAGSVVLYPPIVDREKETIEPLTIPTEYHIATNVAQRLADEIAETISNWLKEGRLLVSEGRPIETGDILILVHKRRPLVAPLIRSLQRRNVAVAGLDRLTLNEHLAVKDILALMAWCDNQADDLALAQVLRSPMVGMSDDELRGYAYGRSGTLWHEVDLLWLREVLRWKTMTPYDFLTQLLEVSGCRKRFAERFGDEVHEVLDELKAQAAAMPANLLPTLAQFHDWIANSTRQIKREQESGASNQVRIMTVHGAKGLEAPVVILADTVSVPTTQHERVFVATMAQGQKLPMLSMSEPAKYAALRERAKQEKSQAILAEYYRLLYVALTRARDELHVFGSASKKGEVKPGSWYQIIAGSMDELAEKQGELLVLKDARKSVKSKLNDEAASISVMPDWVKQAAPRLAQTTSSSLAPSRLEQSQISPYVQAGARGARERGVRIHRVLQFLKQDSDGATIEKLVRYVAPDWDVKEQDRAVCEIAKLYQQEHWLWEHRLMPEVSIAGEIDGRRVNGQIDALVETPDEVVILDYKTGAHVPGTAAEVSLNYLLQLKVYQTLVRQLYPNKPVRCAILWTAIPSLMWLDKEVEKTAFPDKNVMLMNLDVA